MKMSPFRLAVLFFAAGICLLAHSDKNVAAKDYKTWTDTEAQRMLLRSPWASEVPATIVIPKEDPSMKDIPLPQPSNVPKQGPSYNSDAYGVDDGNWDGGVGRLNRGEPGTVPVIVRWDSATPIREALLRTHAPELLDTERTLNDPEKDYIITIIGLVPANKPKTLTASDDETSGDSPTPKFDPHAIRLGLFNAARLFRHGRKPLAPEDVHYDENTGLLQIYFPKTDPIDLQDKEVLFQTTFGTLRVAQRFRLKDMVVNGKLEL